VKTLIIVVAFAVVALSLAPARNPCLAGSITYGFTEGAGAPNPGTIGATVTLSSPPALDSSGWMTDQGSDVLSLQVSDPALFSDHLTGVFTNVSIPDTLASFNGSFLDTGDIELSDNIHLFVIDTDDTNFFILGGGPSQDFKGSWIALASVPEPASSVQAGIACAIGLALAAFRKRKEAWRQRPEGPVDANY
jgi:hypothetical protein